MRERVAGDTDVCVCVHVMCERVARGRGVCVCMAMLRVGVCVLKPACVKELMCERLCVKEGCVCEPSAKM